MPDPDPFATDGGATEGATWRRPGGAAGNPAAPPPPGRRRRGFSAWRLGSPVVLLVCGGLFVVSAVDSDGTDLRPGRSTDLGSIVSSDTREVADLNDRAALLAADVQRLTAGVDDDEVERLSRRVRAVEPAAGRTAVVGRGITVTLSDAPADIRDAYEGNVNDVLVHQQDIEAVVNALWLGGARAVTIQGQRVITTTGIKCSGNVVRLHGTPYSQPYVIGGVGDPADLAAAVLANQRLQVYREQSQQPDLAIGWDLRQENVLRAPAYGGSVDLAYAKPATGS